MLRRRRRPIDGVVAPGEHRTPAEIIAPPCHPTPSNAAQVREPAKSLWTARCARPRGLDGAAPVPTRPRGRGGVAPAYRRGC
jgi:hypothetical protein